MGPASGELFRAVVRLQKAAEAQFSGNPFYMASEQIARLFEFIGPGAVGNQIANSRKDLDFWTALAEVRKAANNELFGNHFYLLSQELDVLSSLSELQPQSAGTTHPSLSTRAASPSEILQSPLNAQSRSFDELSAAARSRVDTVAAGLGISSKHATGPQPAAAPETLADGELERRSSEPCGMAELAPPIMEPVAAASVSAQRASTARAAEAARDFGSPAPEIEHSAVSGTDPAPSPKKADAKPAIQTSSPKNDPPAIAAGQVVGSKKDAESEPKTRKSIFGQWLGLIFGRRV